MSAQRGHFERGPEPPHCNQCEWDGKRLVGRCFTCHRDLHLNSGRRVPLTYFPVAELLADDGADDEPVRFEPPTRPSTLRGRSVPRRGHGASEGDPSL